MTEFIEQLPEGYRQRGVGETVKPDDYVQIHNSYWPVLGSACVGDVLTNTGPFSRFWTKTRQSVS